MAGHVVAKQALRAYEYTPVTVSFWVRVRGHVAARRDRPGVLKGFLHDYGVSHKREINVQTLPKDKYIIRTQYLEHLADVRDAHILREATRARTVQDQLRLEAREVYDTLQREREALREAKQEYEDIKAKLDRGDLTPLEKANHQGKLGTMESSIKNQLATVARIKGTLAEYDKHLAASKKEFAEFCAHTNGAYELVMNSYIKVAGRRLNKLGITNYDAILKDHAHDTTHKIKELTDG